jgi:hypothetical protein
MVVKGALFAYPTSEKFAPSLFIFKNSPKELSFIIPSHLVPDSNYFVIIRTFGGRGNKANKTLKSAIGTNPVKINVA